MELAHRVRQRREQLGLTQDELARRMGYKSRVSVNKIENGRPVSQKIIARLAEALDVSVPYLMGWRQDPEELGELAAQVLADPDLLQLVQDYMLLEDIDKATVRALVASLAEKKRD